MAHKDKIIDQFPIICPAGITTNQGETVEALLKDYSKEHIAASMVRQKDSKIVKKADAYIARPTHDDQVHLALEMIPKSAFKNFENNVKESIFYKRHPLGKTRSANSAPSHINNLRTTFGIPSVISEKLYDVVMPKKKYDEVLRESQEKHANYVLSHGEYNPAEQIRRNYTSSFNPGGTFGVKNDVDPSGNVMKRVMTSSCQGNGMLGTIQEAVKERKKASLGKPLNRMSIPCNLPPDFCFGAENKPDKYRAKLVIYDLKPCLERSALYDALSHINVLRRYLKRYDSVEKIRYELDEHNKWDICSWDWLLEVMLKFHIPINVEKFKLLATFYKFLDDNNNVKCGKCVDLLDSYRPLPAIGVPDKITVCPMKLTTYREMAWDVCGREPNCEDVIAAGSELKEFPRLPPQYCSAHLDSLPMETSVRTVLSPTIPTQVGLSHRDYLLPRAKEEIYYLFNKIGFNEDDYNFEECWKKAKEQWTTLGDLVSIEAFLYAFKQVNPVALA